MFTRKDLYAAYKDCRKHKRNTINALAFEINYEEELENLLEELNSGTYQIGQSICFMVDKPKPREVFAADFRDRIVHHLVMRKIEPKLESNFIQDTYNCRKGKGVLYGVERLEKKIPEAVEYYCKLGWNPDDIYIAKFDCKGFFMSIDRELLAERLVKFTEENYFGEDKADVIRVLRQIILHDPTKNCIRVSPKHKWDGLAPEKSLFHLWDRQGASNREPFEPNIGKLLFDVVRPQMVGAV